MRLSRKRALQSFVGLTNTKPKLNNLRFLKMNFDQCVEAILYGFISNKRKPSKKRLDLLELYFQQGLGLIPSCISLDIADGNSCEELDLPRGSYLIQLVASLLDLKAPLTEEMPRLAQLNKQLIDFGHIKEDV